MAVGGGLIEVLVSPIVEACPTDQKAAAIEPTALVLLLGLCFGHPCFHAVLFRIRNCELEASQLSLGGGSAVQCTLLFAGAYCILA